MSIVDTHYVQRLLPLQLALERFETCALFPRSCHTQAFAPVGRELIEARLDVLQFFSAPLELRLGSREGVKQVG